MSQPWRPLLDCEAELARLRGCLFDSVLPFWKKHAIDQAGGLNTCLGDDGQVISRDKWLWSQWRAVWVFSKLYNDFGRDPQWLDLARHIYRFVAAHGWSEKDHGWNLCLDGEGNVLRGYESIYADGFAIYGLTELAQATGERQVQDLARRTADAVLEKLTRPHSEIPTFPYPTPAGMRVHGLPMIFSLCFWELGRFLGDWRYMEAAVEMSDEIFARFYRPQRNLVLERVSDDGSEAPPPDGTAVVPGHVIEDMWFQIHIARDRGDRQRVGQACDLIQRHCEVGWDEKFGGLLLAVDADGRPDVGWKFADTKLWWPHTEAMYALLLAYEITEQSWCTTWYDRVRDYSFTHFPCTEHGEWIQRLDRRGQVLKDVVALPVKDPFHLPRALMLSIQCLQRIQQREEQS